ncbi:cytochrome C assembly family protein [Thorsellia kenyensis]|uniref:Inner membrane protein YpjD n=1 Tax=Thorsellia kenyensis TaxID=1549888 RepID=A0ABV6CG67_9GAMM
MMSSYITAISLLAYLFSIGLILPAILNPKSYYRKLLLITGSIALVNHGIYLHERIVLRSDNIELGLLNIGSFVSILLSIAAIFISAKDKGWQLLPIAFSFALINLILTAFFPVSFVLHLDATPLLLIHIGMALLAYSTLFICVLYATFLGWINYRLKHKNLPMGKPIPPLLQIERRLLNLIYVGLGFLTITLFVGFVFLPDPFGPHNVHKTLLASTAWCVYFCLILGHHFFGWRGIRVVRINYLGIILLSLAYIGNRLLIGY